MAFTDKEKIDLMKEIEGMYFNKNFGTVSKADFELLLFSRYIDHCINNSIPYDDYNLSQVLGITQSRIRTLKEKSGLKYPSSNFDWKKEFEESIKNAKYDDNNHTFIIYIPNINVMNAVCNYIDTNGWYYECKTRNKFLTMPFKGFIDIFIDDNEFKSVLTNGTKNKIKK